MALPSGLRPLGEGYSINSQGSESTEVDFSVGASDAKLAVAPGGLVALAQQVVEADRPRAATVSNQPAELLDDGGLPALLWSEDAAGVRLQGGSNYDLPALAASIRRVDNQSWLQMQAMLGAKVHRVAPNGLPATPSTTP